MQRFEITVDGAAQPVDYATQTEADAALVAIRQANAGKAVAARVKGDTKPDATKPSPQPHR